jgi:hypothetical protein
MTVDEFFAGQQDAMRLFKSVCRVIDTFGGIEMRFTKSQIAFRRGKSFSWVWMPEKIPAWQVCGPAGSDGITAVLRSITPLEADC